MSNLTRYAIRYLLKGENYWRSLSAYYSKEAVEQRADTLRKDFPDTEIWIITEEQFQVSKKE